VEVYLHSFLTSALGGGEWSVSRIGRFSSRERAPGTNWIGGWVGPKEIVVVCVNVDWGKQRKPSKQQSCKRRFESGTSRIWNRSGNTSTRFFAEVRNLRWSCLGLSALSGVHIKQTFRGPSRFPSSGIWYVNGSCCASYEGVSKSFRSGRLERELQMAQLSATKCSCIAILWVSLVSFVAITLCVPSQRVIFCCCLTGRP
jgi:hypothetical protein